MSGTPRQKPLTVEDLYRVDRSAVERQLGHPIKTLAPWPLNANAPRKAPK